MTAAEGAANLWTLAGTIVTTLGIVVVAGLQFRRQGRKVDDVADTVGQKNGDGNLVQMVGDVLKSQGRIEAQLESGQRRFDRIEGRLQTLEERNRS